MEKNQVTPGSLVLDPLSLEDALEFVARLSMLKNPPLLVAHKPLAERLIDWCRGTDRVSPNGQAEWLIAEALELDEYPGPRVLHKMLEDKFYPSGAAVVHKPTRQEFRGVECNVCQDWWTIQHPALGRYVWCTCANARETRELMPTWLDRVNEYPSLRVPTATKAMMSTKNFRKRIG